MSQIGHVPVLGACKACGYSNDGGREPMAHEPCADQEKARSLVGDGYLALPASPEEFDAAMAAARLYR